MTKNMSMIDRALRLVAVCVIGAAFAAFVAVEGHHPGACRLAWNAEWA